MFSQRICLRIKDLPKDILMLAIYNSMFSQGWTNVSFTARYVICTERSLPNVCDFAISTASGYIHLINTENPSLVNCALQLPIGPVFYPNSIQYPHSYSCKEVVIKFMLTFTTVLFSDSYHHI